MTPQARARTLADQIAYVALASSDPVATCTLFQRHFGLPRTEFSSPEGAVPLFALGRSALAVFPLGHGMLDAEPGAEAKPGVNHIAFGVDDIDAAAAFAVQAGVSREGKSAAGLEGRKCLRLSRASTLGVRTRLTGRVDLVSRSDAAVERIDHIGVASSDVFEDERVFSGQLGFPVESRQTDMEISLAVESFTSDKYGVIYHNRQPEPVGGLRVTFISVGDCELEFLANFNPRQGAQIVHGQAGTTKQDQGAITRFVDSRGRGLHHVALKVCDIESTLAGMAQAGLPMIDVKGRPGSRRALIGFPHPRATGGILMHLVQRESAA